MSGKTSETAMTKMYGELERVGKVEQVGEQVLGVELPMIVWL